MIRIGIQIRISCSGRRASSSPVAFPRKPPPEIANPIRRPSGYSFSRPGKSSVSAHPVVGSTHGKKQTRIRTDTSENPIRYRRGNEIALHGDLAGLPWNPTDGVWILPMIPSPHGDRFGFHSRRSVSRQGALAEAAFLAFRDRRGTEIVEQASCYGQ